MRGLTISGMAFLTRRGRDGAIARKIPPASSKIPASGGQSPPCCRGSARRAARPAPAPGRAPRGSDRASPAARRAARRWRSARWRPPAPPRSRSRRRGTSSSRGESPSPAASRWSAPPPASAPARPWARPRSVKLSSWQIIRPVRGRCPPVGAQRAEPTRRPVPSAVVLEKDDEVRLGVVEPAATPAVNERGQVECCCEALK